jgi:hypothetical protein
VSSSGSVRITGTTRLNSFGQCRLFETADAVSELMFWEFRMKALKWLFFGGEPQATVGYRATTRRGV